MQVRVLKKFKDKNTGNIRKVGEVFEATEERVEEIKTKNAALVEVLTEEVPDGESAKETDAEVPDGETGKELDAAEQEEAGAVCDIAQMTEEQLKELGKARKIKGYTKMSVDELKEALEQ